MSNSEKRPDFFDRFETILRKVGISGFDRANREASQFFYNFCSLAGANKELFDKSDEELREIAETWWKLWKPHFQLTKKTENPISEGAADPNHINISDEEFTNALRYVPQINNKLCHINTGRTSREDFLQFCNKRSTEQPEIFKVGLTRVAQWWWNFYQEFYH